MIDDVPSALLVLHSVRIQGFADSPTIARRFALDPADVEDRLLDAEAHGWVTHSAFAGAEGWSLTDRGRAENERQLAAELSRTGRTADLHEIHRDFLPLNAVLLQACTDWQLRPVAGVRLAPNDHADPAWDVRVLDTLADLDQSLPPLVGRLADVLARFNGYDTRFSAALTRVRAGEHDWLDRTDVDSCHRVWFELHEDLVATLGIDRRTQS